MTTYFLFCILFYLQNHPLLFYFSFFISFFNYFWKNGHFNRVYNTKRLSFVICNSSIMLIFSYFTSCISHLSLVIIFNKVSVSVHLEATAGKSSTKLLLYFSTKPIKIYLWKCSIFVKVAGCRLASLLNLNFCTDIFQKFGPCNQFNTL